MARVNYYISTFFHEEFHKLIRKKMDFEFIRTSYTKKLKTKSHITIFNPEGTGDEMILSLINKIRKDAAKYLELNSLSGTGRIDFLKLFEIPKEDEVIMKVDLTSAYWRQSLLDGIISQETNNYFSETFKERSGKELKGIRLKALGSLATRKEIEVYEKGKSVDWMAEEEPTKPLYMDICRKIDELMRQCKVEISGCIFYYWDCMFIRKSFAKDAIEFFKNRGFECKMEETSLTYDIIGNKGYFTSEIDNKMYMVSEENKEILTNKYN